MIAWILAATAAAGTEVVVLDGVLRPGRAATLEVAATDAVGRALSTPPPLEILGASHQAFSPIRPGVWHWSVVPSLEHSAVEVSSGELKRRFEVLPPAESALRVPGHVDGLTTDPFVPIPLAGLELADVDALDIALPADAAVLDVVEGDGGVVLHVFPGEGRYPRIVPVGIRDRRGDDQPAWILLRLSARPKLPIEAEPGAQLSLTVGGRSYGPFFANPRGQIEARFDQLPGEAVAHAKILDDLGNETQAEIPLVTAPHPVLLALADGEIRPDQPPPMIHLFAAPVTAGGPGPALPPPACRTPTSDLPVLELGPRRWVVPLPAQERPSDLRVVCAVSEDTEASIRVPIAQRIPDHLSVRIYPEDLRADFPVAELRVTLEDVRGERLPTSGVEIEADHGEIHLDRPEGNVLRGEYLGDRAIPLGADRIAISYTAPPGEGPVHELTLSWGASPRERSEPLVLLGRALDRLRRPLAGVEITFELGGRTARGTTGPHGWASASIPPPAGSDPLIVRAFIEGSCGSTGCPPALLTQHLRIPGDSAQAGPGTPDLYIARALTIRPGRLAGLSVSVDPPILRAAPGAIAYVTVRIEDRSGQLITDEDVEIKVSEGSLSELQVRSDGTLVAEYTPVPGERRREVELTATTESMRSSTRLVLEPRIVRFAFGPWVGAQTNFGRLHSAVGGLDLDMRSRTRWFGESMMLRLAIQGTSFRSLSATGVGPKVEILSIVVPVTAAVLFRDDRGPWSLWGGVGATVALHRQQTWFGSVPVGTGQTSLAGPAVLTGLARRALRGEIGLSLRSHWLPATASGEIGYTGNLGGVGVGLGYRLVY